MVGFWNCQEPINGYQVTTLHQSIRRPLLRYAFSCFYYVDTVALCLLLKPTTITFQPLRNIKDFRHGFFLKIFFLLLIYTFNFSCFLSIYALQALQDDSERRKKLNLLKYEAVWHFSWLSMFLGFLCKVSDVGN